MGGSYPRALVRAACREALAFEWVACEDCGRRFVKRHGSFYESPDLGAKELWRCPNGKCGRWLHERWVEMMRMGRAHGPEPEKPRHLSHGLNAVLEAYKPEGVEERVA